MFRHIILIIIKLANRLIPVFRDSLRRFRLIFRKAAVVTSTGFLFTSKTVIDFFAGIRPTRVVEDLKIDLYYYMYQG